MFKRGISPLIATVLIIGFTVALGSVIMTWGGGFISGLQKGSETSAAKSETCAATSLELTKSEQDTPNTINFLLENLGNTEIEAFTVRVTGEDGIDAFDVNQKLGLTTKKQFHVNFDSAKTGIVTNIEVIPKVSVSGKTEDCTPGSSFTAEPPSQEDVNLWQTKIGNMVIDPWEECDSSANPQFPEDINGASQPLICASFGFTGGALTCTAEGLIDTTSCTGDTTCGNGILDTNEKCDTVNGAQTFFGSVTDCATLGTALEDPAPWTGQIYCANDCMIDQTQCTTGLANCGNGAIDQYDECDGTNLGTETCITKGFAGGTIACLDNCRYDTSTCTQSICGNNIKDGTEQCDGTDLAAQTCQTKGFDSGTLTCKTDCTFETSACTKTIVTQVSVAEYTVTSGLYACAITNTEELYCWGQNGNYQLGTGDLIARLIPKKIALSGVKQVATGGTTTCAITTSGLYCWGQNNYGQIGDGTTTTRTTPTLIMPASTNPTTVNVGVYHTCAINNNGLYCWGYNWEGAIGDGTQTQRNTPTLIMPASTNPTKVSVDGFNTCAINNNGLYCWGDNNWGTVGDGTAPTDKLTPTLIMPASTNPTKVSISSTACAINNNGLYCWGYNAVGQIGDGTTTTRTTPTLIMPASTNPTTVKAGPYHTCAINNNGLYCWGSNAQGQIGDGTTTTPVLTPKQITTQIPSALSVGFLLTCATMAEELYCWGYNGQGQVGDGTTTPVFKTSPTKIGLCGDGKCELPETNAKCAADCP